MVQKAEFIEMAESIDLEFGEGSTMNFRREGQNPGERNSNRKHQGSNSGQKRSDSPLGVGKKTNTSLQYSAKGGTSRLKDPKNGKKRPHKKRPPLEEPKRLTKEEEAEY